MTHQQILALIKREKIEFVDYRFMDFPGLWQHLTAPAKELTLEVFEHGIGFDGSSIRGWQAINEADMLLMPVAETAKVDPFTQHKTLALICNIKDPVTQKNYSRDPRSIARKASQYLKDSKVGDAAYFGPEMEFFVFDNVSYEQTVNQASYHVDSEEGIWNRGKKDPTNRGNQIRLKEGFFPCMPVDRGQDIRSEMVTTMMQMGIAVEGHHHEVATGGQGEIDLCHQDLLDMADTCMYYKYVVKNVAARHGKVATFMPKPLYQDNGSGMHTHFSIWKNNEPVMAGRHYAGLSQLGLYVIGGILKHTPALLALTNPTTNSYKRMVPGYEAPVNLIYSTRNRSAAIRIPLYQKNPKTKRLEFRCPDSSCNPYLAFAAILMAAIDGVKNKIDPGEPLDKDIAELSPKEFQAIGSTPASLDQALDALEKDHQFLLEGNVFTEDVIRYWIKYKRENEIQALQSRPHPFEFCMYFDI